MLRAISTQFLNSSRLRRQPRIIGRLFCDDNKPGTSKDPPIPEASKKATGKHVDDLAEYYRQYIKEYSQDAAQDLTEPKQEWVASTRNRLNIARGRGQSGVFDLAETVEFLRAERAADVVVLRMPASLAYAPYMIIATALNRRHMNAVTEKFRKAYKAKRAIYDPPTARVEDETNPEWRAFDFGNVVVHLMTDASRQRYDIEMLWSVGPEHDDLTAVDPLNELAEKLKNFRQSIRDGENQTVSSSN